MREKLVFSILFLLFCSGCAQPLSSNSIPPDSISPVISERPSETPSPSPNEIKFVVPTSKLFDLDGVDAALYDAAVEFYCWRGGEYDLLLPALSILDTYSDEAGNTYYVCWFWQFDYYGLGKGLNDIENPMYTLNSGKELARFTISVNADGELTCSNIMEVGDGEGMYTSIDIICGPNTELATAIKNNTELPVIVRDITPVDPVEMLNAYLKFYF